MHKHKVFFVLSQIGTASSTFVNNSENNKKKEQTKSIQDHVSQCVCAYRVFSSLDINICMYCYVMKFDSIITIVPK